MIKYLKYMFVVAIVMIAATGCQEDWEDTFSKEPTAPELVNNGMILMTKNTMSESITCLLYTSDDADEQRGGEYSGDIIYEQ